MDLLHLASSLHQDDNNRFYNPHIIDRKRTFATFLRWRFHRRKSSKPKLKHATHLIPQKKVLLEQLHAPSTLPQITWLGHSTLLIQYQGINILTDPVFSMRLSPIKLFSPVRYMLPPVDLASLPQIHYVLISHNHYDHLDTRVAKYFGNTVQWVLPLQLASWFSKRKIIRTVERDWWQSFEEHGISFLCTPAQHWSRRGVNDTCKTLWSSWAITIGDFKFWFAGDTGYNSIHFKEIGNACGPFDMAAIPIGAYSPHWLMHDYHVTPEEAVLIHLDVRAHRSIGIHWGTFALSDEPFDEPPRLLAASTHTHNLPQQAFTTWAIGETQEIQLP